MPLINEPDTVDVWSDLDYLPRPVVTIGANGITADSFDRQETDFHSHRKGELVLTLRGVITCEVENALWAMPPQTALWIPPGVVHKAKAAGTIDCYIGFIEQSVTSNLPKHCCALVATPLLRELLIRSASLPVLYSEGGIESHLITLLLDELALAPMSSLHLPMPADPRLRKIVDSIMLNPADRGTVRRWAHSVGLSERTLARLLSEETGMSFGRWRQQIHLILAVRWLGAGASVQHVADNLGYESSGNFVKMFRRAFGVSPRRYMAQNFFQRDYLTDD